jgi:Putative peptidoglycan binding domain
MLTLPANSEVFEDRTINSFTSTHQGLSALPCSHRQRPRREKKALSIRQALVAFLLLTMTAYAAGQEIIPRRAEGMREERLRENQRRFDPDYERKAKAAQEAFDRQWALPVRPKTSIDEWNQPYPHVSLHRPSGQGATLRQRALWGGSLVGADQVRVAQERLANLGYLDPNVDVDGKIGPRTRQALSKFQSDHGLNTTGDLDIATKMELNASASVNLLRELGPLRLGLEELREQDSHKYRLHDESGNMLFQGGDRAELAAKLNELLSREDQQVVYLETSGFSENGVEALASSLRIQQHQIDPSVSMGVMEEAAEDSAREDGLPVEQSILSTPGIRLARGPIAIDKIRSGVDAGKIRAKLGFSIGLGQNVRRVTSWILCASVDWVLEFLERLHVLRPVVSFDQSLSLQQLVVQARTDMKKAHPGLTDEQLRVLTRDQSGKIELLELYLGRPFAWC